MSFHFPEAENFPNAKFDLEKIFLDPKSHDIARFPATKLKFHLLATRIETAPLLGRYQHDVDGYMEGHIHHKILSRKCL